MLIGSHLGEIHTFNWSPVLGESGLFSARRAKLCPNTMFVCQQSTSMHLLGDLILMAMCMHTHFGLQKHVCIDISYGDSLGLLAEVVW